MRKSVVYKHVNAQPHCPARTAAVPAPSNVFVCSCGCTWHVCACSCLYATSVCVSVCIRLWAVLERYCPAAGSDLHYSTDQASQYTLKGKLNKGKEKNKTAKAEVVLCAPWNGEISQFTNKRKREVMSICIDVCKMACWKQCLRRDVNSNGGCWIVLYTPVQIHSSGKQTSRFLFL